MFSFYGPLSLILLLVVWAGAMVLGFGLIYFALGSPFNDAAHTGGLSIGSLRERNHHLHAGSRRRDAAGSVGARARDSGVGHGTGLSGRGDGVFSRSVQRVFAARSQYFASRCAGRVAPDGCGAACAATRIRRSRTGAVALLTEWERWSAELLESHISYPQLCYFRSQHTNQSWLSALTAILDTSALLIAGVTAQEARQAQLTFAMARHAVVDLAQIFSLRAG